MQTSGQRHWWQRRTAAAPTAAPDTGPTSATSGPTPAPAASPGPAPSAPQPAAPDPRDVEAAVLSRLHDYVRVQVRSGVFDLDELRTITIEAATAEVREPGYADLLARRVLSAELTDWYAEASSWSGRTDPERLDAALDALAVDGVLVLAALPAASDIDEARRVRGNARGCVAYTVGDIWNSLDHAELPLTVLDGDGAPVARGAALLTALMDALAGEGLLGHALGTPPRVVVPLHWRRRPAPDPE